MKFSIFFLTLISLNAQAQKFTWFGTTNIVIQDEDVDIMFDPFITHPSLIEIFFKREVYSDKKLVKKWIDKASVNHLDAVIVNHSHYDHALDFGTILNMFPQAIGYGSKSTYNIGLGANIPKERLIVVDDKKDLAIKSYKLKSIKAMHPAHAFGYTAMPDKIEKPFKLPANPWNMHKGQDLIYHLTNAKGNIMFHPFAGKSPFFNDYSKLKARVLFLGLAKRKSTMDQIENIIKPINPSIIIPVHYDNFVVPLKSSPTEMPTMNLDEWTQTIKTELPNIKIIIPQVAKWIDLK